jgi:hypothetical protein
MQNNQTLQLNDSDLSVPNLTWGILLISFLGLYLELLFIRWIGTEIRIFAYLQNTILMVCFLGLGLGMFTSSKPILLKQSLLPLSFLLLLMAIPSTRSILGNISEMLSVLDDLVIWSGFQADDKNVTIALLIIGLLLTFLLLVLIVDIFIPIGRIMGRMMNAHPNPIWAYSVNISGSIIGSWAFVLLSFFYQPPFTWFLIAIGLLVLFIIWTGKDTRLNFILLISVGVFSLFASRNSTFIETIWSPYQKLSIRESLNNEIQ